MKLPFAAVLVCLAVPLASPAQVPPVVEGRCALCHGKLGESASEEFPRLAGQNESYLAKQLGDFKAKRRAGVMERFAKDLSEADIAAIARHYAAQPAGRHETGDAELAAVGRFVYLRGNPATGVPACKACHGENAWGSPVLPRLAGQHAKYLEREIREFTQRKRTNDNEVMHTVAEKLAPLEIHAVAHYLAGLP